MKRVVHPVFLSVVCAAMAVTATVSLSGTASAQAPPDTIPADCSVDVSTELNAWLAALPDGVVVDFGTGCYLVEQTLQVVGKTDVMFSGGTFRALTTGEHLPAWDGKEANWPRHRAHWRIQNSTRVTFNDTRVEGPNSNFIYDSTLEAQHGFAVGNGSATFNNVIVRNVWGDFVTAGENSVDVIITGLDGSGAGRQGIGIVDSTNVVLQDSTLDRVRRSCVDVEPLGSIGQVVSGVIIRNNNFIFCGNTTVGVGGSGSSSNITIDGNTSTQPWFSKIGSSGPRTNFTFTNNVSLGSPTSRVLLTLGAWTDVKIENNTMPVSPQRCTKGVCNGGFWLVLDDTHDAEVDQVRIL